MPPITSYPTALTPGVAGQIADTGERDVVSLVNDNPRTAQVSTITVDTATNSATYTWTIDGVELTYTADSSTSAAEIVAGIVAAINADPIAGAKCTAAATSSTVVTLTARVGGVSFSVSDSDAKLTSATTTANDTADTIGFGLAVLSDDDGIGTQATACDSSLLSAAEIVVTPTAVNSATYNLHIEFNGSVYGASYTADGSATVKEIVEGLAAAVNAAVPASTVLATEDDSVLTLTSEIVGATLKVYVGANLVAAPISGDNLSDVFAGITLLDHARPIEDAGYVGGSAMSVLRDGRVIVETEDDVSGKRDVYVRVASTGTLGALRGSAATGCIKLDRSVCRFVERLSSTLAVVEVHARA